MTRNCLNVMRKYANGLQAAGKAPATGSVLGRMVGTARPGIADPMPGSARYRINQQQNVNGQGFVSNPHKNNLQRTGGAAYNTQRYNKYRSQEYEPSKDPEPLHSLANSPNGPHATPEAFNKHQLWQKAQLRSGKNIIQDLKKAYYMGPLGRPLQKRPQ